MNLGHEIPSKRPQLQDRKWDRRRCLITTMARHVVLGFNILNLPENAFGSPTMMRSSREYFEGLRPVMVPAAIGLCDLNDLEARIVQLAGSEGGQPGRLVLGLVVDHLQSIALCSGRVTDHMHISSNGDNGRHGSLGDHDGAKLDGLAGLGRPGGLAGLGGFSSLTGFGDMRRVEFAADIKKIEADESKVHGAK
ncbi:hypothetical protein CAUPRSCDRAFT_10910 [Caulochytrium protostelioides]|uniref:Uncharacterized protein n=1 Tax=Caulochytrium protostelioides TaxID=1555241 RepID=A0A4P9X112_9FUNG|nr:hypothetical protein CAUPRSCDRAFT_10910 [Caulochytrium protostelioides]